jgi:hypothetical protein
VDLPVDSKAPELDVPILQSAKGERGIDRGGLIER